MSPELTVVMAIGAAMMTGVASNFIQGIFSRRREGAEAQLATSESAKVTATRDEIYTGIAAKAWARIDEQDTIIARQDREIEGLRRKLRDHDRRWFLMVPLLESYVREHPDAKERLEEIKVINHLTGIDDGCS